MKARKVRVTLELEVYGHYKLSDMRKALWWNLVHDHGLGGNWKDLTVVKAQANVVRRETHGVERPTSGTLAAERTVYVRAKAKAKRKERRK
jgi:hypothetical protein